MSNTTSYVIRIDATGATGRPLPEGCFLAGGATWDGAWWTNQANHPEEIVKRYKTERGAEKRADELRKNGVTCRVLAMGKMITWFDQDDKPMGAFAGAVEQW